MPNKKTTKNKKPSKGKKSNNKSFLTNLVSKTNLNRKFVLITIVIIFSGIGLYTLLRSKAHSAFVHPGILVSQNQLDFIKNKVARGEEPWISSYNKMKGSTLAKKTYTPSPVSKLMCSNDAGIADGIPQVGCDEMNNDAAATYIQALMYVMTGEKVYADNAAKIINAWASTLKDIPYDEIRASNGNPGYWQNTLVVGWSAETMTRGAEIIRYTSNSMNQNDTKKSEDWFKNIIYPFLAKNDYIRNGNANGGQTWTEALVNIGIYTNDRSIYDKGIKWYKSKSPQLVYLTKDGNKPFMATDPDSGKPWYGTVDEHWRYPNQYINGQETETCRDMGHTFMGLGPYANTAETALIQGTHDLYAENEERFIAAFELNTGFVNEMLDRMAATGQTANKVKESGWKPTNFPCKKFSDGGQSAFLGTEIAYNHFVNRRGKSMPNTKRLMERVRPQSGGNHMFYETLTHANTGNVGITKEITLPVPETEEALNKKYTAIDDTYVRDGKYSNDIFDKSTVLPITNKNLTNGYTRRAYLKFDSSEFNKLTTVDTAKLKVYARLANGSSSKIEIFEVPENTWSGAATNWNNQPKAGVKVGEFTLSTSSYGWQEIDITNWIANNIDKTKTNLSFVFIAEQDNAGFAEFTSLESSSKPELEIKGKINSNQPPTAPPIGVSPPQPVNQSPSVTLKDLSSTYQLPAEIMLSADASDPDGSVAKVEYFHGSKKIGESSNQNDSYAVTWSNPAAGNYEIHAKAFDSQGLSSESGIKAITVKPQNVSVPNDKEKPSPPTSITKKLERSQGRYYLALSWQPSIDNVGIKNYQIMRNNINIGSASAAYFKDTSFKTGTSYNYSIIAVDKEGNTSSPATLSAKANCFLIWCFL